MRKHTLLSLIALVGLTVVPVTVAQTLVEEWTFDGGGLDPATYSGNFRPASLFPDSGSTATSISPTGLVVVPFGSGGLGSASAGAYGGIYTFFAETAAFTMQTINIVPGLETVTFSFLAGGGSPTLVSYDISTLVLNYNGGNTSVAASSFSAVPGIIVDSPIGQQDLTLYTWTWDNLAALGTTTGFSTAWNAQGQEHVFYTDFTLTQSVPEPTAAGLVLLGAGILLRRRRPEGAC
jgi:hypothetical protein